MVEGARQLVPYSSMAMVSSTSSLPEEDSKSLGIHSRLGDGMELSVYHTSH